MTLIYLHGFRSSPSSYKARVLEEAMHSRGLSHRFLCPALPASPQAAIELASNLVQACDPSTLTIVGSSLGGYYATWLAEHTGARAVLLNPVVHAARELRRYVGEHRMYHSDEAFEFLPEFVTELESLAVPTITRPERYLLLAATGDEVLDWREMRDHYRGARQIIITGSDHGLSDFAEWLPDVVAFAGIPDASPSP